MEIFTKSSNKNSLEFIEVKPACRNKNSKRTVKYIGETMMNFLAQVTKMSGKKYVSVPHPDSEAIGFYKKCFCALSGQTQGFTLAEDNMDKLKISNFEHTGAEINILSQYKKRAFLL